MWPTCKNETELLWSIKLGRSMMKTTQDNDVTNHIGLVYAEIETKLLGPIWLGVVCD